jgi:hypothetical protein
VHPYACAQVTRCAEVIHFKAMMLLLHQGRAAEALAQFRDHLETFGPLPRELPHTRARVCTHTHKHKHTATTQLNSVQPHLSLAPAQLACSLAESRPFCYQH